VGGRERGHSFSGIKEEKQAGNVSRREEKTKTGRFSQGHKGGVRELSKGGRREVKKKKGLAAN